MKYSLRLLYLYLFSFVGLLVTVVGSIQILDLTLKSYVFQVNDYTFYPDQVSPEGKPRISAEEMIRRNQIEQANQTKRQLSSSLAMILVGTPLYLYHWHTIKKEKSPA